MASDIARLVTSSRFLIDLTSRAAAAALNFLYGAKVCEGEVGSPEVTGIPGG